MRDLEETLAGVEALAPFFGDERRLAGAAQGVTPARDGGRGVGRIVRPPEAQSGGLDQALVLTLGENTKNPSAPRIASSSLVTSPATIAGIGVQDPPPA